VFVREQARILDVIGLRLRARVRRLRCKQARDQDGRSRSFKCTGA
jgi:hypothetical protein